MSVLKFRVVIEEVEDLYRDIEILPTQTFFEFHEALIKYFEIKKKKPASFFLANDKLQKTKEISLGFAGTVDTSTDGTKETLGKFVSKKQKLLIYFNESTPNLTYIIELIDDSGEALRSKYPVCVKSVGSATLMNDAVSELFSDNSRVEAEDGDDEGGSSDGYDDFGGGGSESDSGGGGYDE
jgi:hypothetical protein